MHYSELPTPAFLLDLDILERNVSSYAAQAHAHGKLFCPMTKTSKSTALIRMQAEAGADGFLTGTLAEAEALVPFGKPIMPAYPIADAPNIARARRLLERAEVILALDSLDCARRYQQAFAGMPAPVPYLLTVDVGLGRLGVLPETAAGLAREIAAACPALQFRGIATHPGQVYGCATPAEAQKVAQAEHAIFLQLAAQLREAGLPPEILATGSTPTFRAELTMPGFNMLRPGNYLFHDLGQLLLGAAREEDCALTVLATIISRPAADRFIIDCGSKCLGLDRGAHASAAFTGYGQVLGHPELEITSLSEEVGKVHITGRTTLEVGDRVRILPNHACPVANSTSYLTGLRGEEVERAIPIDLRANSLPPV